MLNDEKVKKATVWTLSFLSIFIIAKTISEARGWSFIGTDHPPQTTITVTGKGDVVVKPDVAVFTFGVTNEALAIADAQKKTTGTANDIVDFLRKNGVDEKDLKTTGYNIYPRYDYVNGPDMPIGKRVLGGYDVSEAFEVKVHALADAGKIIGSVGKLGATDISQLSFTVDKEEQAQEQAREAAIADARANAAKLAAALGVKLVRVVSFYETGNQPPIYYAKAMAMGAASSGANPELPSGSDKISSNVSVTYEIR